MQKTALRLKAAVYIRVSTSKQEKWSPDAQRRVLLEHCERMGWEPVIYSETGSGETLEGRPQIQRLLKDATAKEFSLCLVIEQERLSRDKDLMDWLVIVKTFRDAGIQIATPSQTYNLADAEDSFLTNLFGVLSAREKHKMLERTKRGRQQAKSQGKYLNEWVPYGFQIVGGKYELHPEESERVRWMARLAETHSRRHVARELTRLGVPTKTGLRYWTGVTVNQLLRNPALCGELLFAGQVYPIPPILSKGEWVALQERFKTRRRDHQKYPYLLRGLLFCSLCGRALHGRTTISNYQRKDGGRRTHRYYVCCGNSTDIRDCRLPVVRGTDLETLIWAEVKAYLKAPKLIYDALELAVSEKDSQEATKGQEEARLARQIADLAKEEAQLGRAFYGRSALTEESFNLSIKEIRQDRVTLEMRLKEVKETRTPDVKESVSLKDLRSACAEIAEGIEDFDFEAQREILTLLVDKIIVHADFSSDIRCKIPLVEVMKSGARPVRHNFNIKVPSVPRKKRGSP